MYGLVLKDSAASRKAWMSRAHPVPGSQPPSMAQIWQDNPGGAKEAKLKAQAIANEKAGNPDLGKPTAGFFGRLPTSMLSGLEGMMGEHLIKDKTTNEKAKKIADSIRKNGIKENVFILVDHKGVARIGEGNHRVALAAKFKQATVPVEVQYFAGGENAKGNFNLLKVYTKHGMAKKMDLTQVFKDAAASFKAWLTRDRGLIPVGKVKAKHVIGALAANEVAAADAHRAAA